MGYDATYKIVGELDDKFKPIFKKVTKQELNKYKNLVIGTCMLVKNLEVVSLSKLYDNITAYTRMYIEYIINNWKVDLKESLKDSNEIHVCGWDFSKSGPSYYPEDIEDVMNNTVENIFYIAINYTSDILDDSEKYYAKLNLIRDELDIEEYIYEIMEHLLFDTYARAEGSEFKESY